MAEHNTLNYCERKIADIKRIGVDHTWYSYQLFNISPQDNDLLRRNIDFQEAISEVLDDDSVSDEEYDTLKVKFGITHSGENAFQYGLNLVEDDGRRFTVQFSNFSKNSITCRLNEEVEFLRFHKTLDNYGCFSNFSKHGFTLKDKTWKTCEHYYQSAKFDFRDNEINGAHTAFDVAQMGRQKHRKIREDWDIVKFDIMLEGLRAKFSQNEDIQKILFETMDHIIIEHTRNDSYWGDAGDSSGLNYLGIALMNVRETLRPFFVINGKKHVFETHLKSQKKKKMLNVLLTKLWR